MHQGRKHLLARGWLLTLSVMTAVACTPRAEQVAIEATMPPTVAASMAPASPAEPSPAPEPATVTPEEYQQALTTLDERIAGRVKRVDKLRGPSGLDERVRDLRERVDEEREALAEVVPPETVADAHQDLENALSDLSADLKGLASDTASGAVCSGPGALRRAGNGDGASAVREAAAKLAEADPVEEYTVGAFVPERGEELNRRGRNGDLRAGKRGGRGQLRITGSPDSDALIKLRNGEQGIRNVYVRRNSTVEVNQLPDGNYDAFIAYGVDWNDKTGRFMRECSFSRLDGKLEFTTTSTQYTIWDLQLRTLFGNTSSTELDPDEFPDG